MIDAVRMGLTALRSQENTAAPAGAALLEVDGSEGAWLSVDELGRPHLLLEVETDPAADPPKTDVATLDIAHRTLVVGDRTILFLDVTCLFESVAEVFEHFVVAVLDRLRVRPGAPTPALSEVLYKWRAFLAPTQGPPGREKLAAVFGELLVLLDVVRADPTRRVDVWVGPFGGRHDIRRGSVAIEVKTSRLHTTRTVRIHGEDQLEPPDEGELHLHFVRLEEVPAGGWSVAGLVDDLLEQGVNAERLFDALAAAGIPLTDLAATADVTFEVIERLTVPVDDQTPRIVPASFSTGARPLGVLDLSYVIDLDHTLDRALDSNAYTALIDAIAKQA